jgi:hypothetical protein
MLTTRKTAVADFFNSFGTELNSRERQLKEGIPDPRKGLWIPQSDLKAALGDYHLTSAAFRTYRPGSICP